MFFVLGLIFLAVLAASAASPSRTIQAAKRWPIPVTPFVVAQDGQFFLNGSAFQFVGTSAYWLSSLNNEEDIDATLAAIKAANFTVVRTWAFNDVDSIPDNGTWFQLISNGTLTINDGPNGLQKLDKVIELAQKHGLYLLLSLTNNWSPIPGIDPQPLPPDFNPVQIRQLQGANNTNTTLPRNALSNSYGGMDTYLRNFGGVQEHSQFFTNQTIKDAFMNYTTQIVTRYRNQTHVFGWELANDPRCNSTIRTSDSCVTQNVTQWHSDLAKHVKFVDPNHVVSSGHQGYLCHDCVKLFPRVVPSQPPPAPRPSPAPGARRRSQPEPQSKARLLKEKKAAWKRERQRQKRAGELSDGVKIRGRWTASHTKRQSDLGMGTAFDGSHGVDSEDIIGIPEIGFGSFQLFPDQYDYTSTSMDLDPSLPAFNRTLQIGLAWILIHAELARLFNKPMSLTGFGLVTQGNSPFFVPFNTTIAPFGPDEVIPTNVPQPFGVTDAQRDDAYTQWIQAGIFGGLQGIIQYQWSQNNLTAEPGTAITTTNPETSQSPLADTSGQSPNDGYGLLGQGQQQAIDSIAKASQGFGPDNA